LKLIGHFEQLKDKILTETTFSENQEILNEFFPDKLATAVHGRKRPTQWDLNLHEIVWLANDFAMEKQFKKNQAKYFAEFLAAAVI
jgi:hypothetical protein